MFASETDTEVRRPPDRGARYGRAILGEAVRRTVRELDGAYALVVLPVGRARA